MLPVEILKPSIVDCVSLRLKTAMQMLDDTRMPTVANTQASIDAGTPVKKLERSMKHSIDLASIPTGLNNDFAEGAVFLFRQKDAAFIKENARDYAAENWTSKVNMPMHSNGDSRRSLEPPLTPRYSSGANTRNLAMQSEPDHRNDSNINLLTAFLGEDRSLNRSWSTSSTSREASSNEDYLEYCEAEQRFLEANQEYTKTLVLENVKREQYPDLQSQRHTYMDWANFALSSKFQTEEHMKLTMAEEHCLGSGSSHLLEHVSDVQVRLLRMFNTSKTVYSVVFTTSFRTAYRLVANAYPFRKGSPLLLCQDNHEAVRQLIYAAANGGAQLVLAPLGENDLCMTKHNMRPTLKRMFFQPSGSLLVYPAQSNITGIRHSLEWVAPAHKSGWHVLLDVSTLLPTGPLDLSHHQPDFVIGSFENMVGYPSSMGFLLVKRTSFCVNPVPDSETPTITLTSKVSPSLGKDYHIVCDDETPSLLLFSSLNFGLQHLQSVGLGMVNKRVRALALWIVHNLKSLRHEDEYWHLMHVYSPFTEENRGNIVSFNVLDSTGDFIKPSLVKKIAARNRITLGVGSGINPGVANLLGPPGERVKNISVFGERSTDFACVQVSLGIMSNFEDAYRVVQLLTRFRDPEFVSKESAKLKEETLSTRVSFRRH